jgi:enamine deaminase RidA (YjgF/YER057c/UK114 family)
MRPGTERIEPVHVDGNHDRFNMPYTAGVVHAAGRLMFVSGVTAAPVYHSHPHVESEFDDIALDPGVQTEMAMDILESILDAAGAGLGDLVDVMRFIVDADANQDAINRTMGHRLGHHRPATTSVEVVRLATDPRLVLELRAVAAVPDGGGSP